MKRLIEILTSRRAKVVQVFIIWTAVVACSSAIIIRTVDKKRADERAQCEAGHHVYGSWCTSGLSMGQQMRFCKHCNLRQDTEAVKGVGK
jgi:hypothetical protein